MIRGRNALKWLRAAAMTTAVVLFSGAALFLPGAAGISLGAERTGAGQILPGAEGTGTGQTAPGAEGTGTGGISPGEEGAWPGQTALKAEGTGAGQIALAAATDTPSWGDGASEEEEALRRSLEEVLKSDGELESFYGNSQELEELVKLLEQALGDEQSLTAGEAADMEKIVDPPMSVTPSGDNLIYSLPGDHRFTMSVPNGMTTTSPVFFQPVENARLTILLNGADTEPAPDGIYSRSGTYHIKMLALANNAQSGNRNLYEVNLEFTILPQQVSNLNLLRAPEGFEIRTMEVDGRQIRPDSPRWHFLHEDGRYQVRFEDEQGDGLSYHLSFYRDTQAPLLAISPALDRREMKGTVLLELKEDMAQVEMYYNGKLAPTPLSRLELAGLYQFRLQDGAGNERYYDIRMGEQLRPPGIKAIIITVAGVAAAAGWFFYLRRHPRFL